MRDVALQPRPWLSVRSIRGKRQIFCSTFHRRSRDASPHHSSVSRGVARAALQNQTPLELSVSRRSSNLAWCRTRCLSSPTPSDPTTPSPQVCASICASPLHTPPLHTPAASSAPSQLPPSADSRASDGESAAKLVVLLLVVQRAGEDKVDATASAESTRGAVEAVSRLANDAEEAVGVSLTAVCAPRAQRSRWCPTRPGP